MLVKKNKLGEFTLSNSIRSYNEATMLTGIRMDI